MWRRLKLFAKKKTGKKSEEIFRGSRDGMRWKRQAAQCWRPNAEIGKDYKLVRIRETENAPGRIGSRRGSKYR